MIDTTGHYVMSDTTGHYVMIDTTGHCDERYNWTLCDD